MKHFKTFENFFNWSGDIPVITPEMRQKWAEEYKKKEEDKKKPIDNPPLKTIPKHKSSFLYHATNIKNLYDIKQYGLIPDFGETTKQAYGEYYDFDKTGNEELQQLDFDGILFFAEEPLLRFSQWGWGKQRFYWNKCLLTIVEKNDTIFQKLENEKFMDYKGKETNYAEYVNIQNCPFFIETGDWFSFESQKPKYILWGDNLKNFIKLNFPYKYKNPD